MRRARHVVAVAIAAILVRTGTPALALPAVKGDTAAWIEVTTAYTRLNRLRTYRVRLSALNGSKGILEVVNPDRFHIVMEVGKARIETIQVGKELRLREGGKWQCIGQAPAFPTTDPTSVTGEISVARQGQELVNDVQARVYTYAQRKENVISKRKVYVAVRSGLPLRLEALNVAWQVERRLDYYDYNAPISIALPPCR